MCHICCCFSLFFKKPGPRWCRRIHFIVIYFLVCHIYLIVSYIFYRVIDISNCVINTWAKVVSTKPIWPYCVVYVEYILLCHIYFTASYVFNCVINTWAKVVSTKPIWSYLCHICRIHFIVSYISYSVIYILLFKKQYFKKNDFIVGKKQMS